MKKIILLACISLCGLAACRTKCPAYSAAPAPTHTAFATGSTAPGGQ